MTFWSRHDTILKFKMIKINGQKQFAEDYHNKKLCNVAKALFIRMRIMKVKTSHSVSLECYDANDDSQKKQNLNYRLSFGKYL